MERIIVIVGPLGVGKTNVSHQIYDELEKTNRKTAIVSVHPSTVAVRTISELLEDGYSVIYDAPNLRRKDRAAILSLGYDAACYIAGANFSGKPADLARFKAQVMTFEMPKNNEGFARIVFKKGSPNAQNPSSLEDALSALEKVYVDKEKTLTALDHCLYARDWLEENGITDKTVLSAMLLHELSRIEFPNSHTNYNVSALFSLSVQENGVDIVRRAQLISEMGGAHNCKITRLMCDADLEAK